MASWNRHLTYHRRLFLWLLAYSLILIGGIVAYQYHREKQFKADELNAQLQLINTYILNELDEGHDIDQMQLSELHRFKDFRVSIIAADGRLIYDNAADRISATNHAGREEIARAMRHGSGYTLRRHSQSTGDTYFYSASRGAGGEIVRTAVPYSLSLSQLLEADSGFIWIIAGITAIMCLLGFFATRRLGQSISRLNTFAENAEKGQRIAETEPFPNDELGEISNHIVRLYARLQRALTERDKEHSAAIHQQQEKERIKKQLTNNINHELKTPVAAIQVCLETLHEHPDLTEDQREIFLQRCLANTDRLRRLLSDVALITRMDDGDKAIIKESVSLTDIISDVVAAHETAARAKGITIKNSTTREIKLTGNQSLLESIFNNLTDNAIAYSGGSVIDISETPDADHRVTITFADNGTGVDAEHLPRLFERFYRIDKGRSRAAGGTGLGLSIVKNAVLQHGGTVTVSNRRTGGLLFTISLPISQ